MFDVNSISIKVLVTVILTIIIEMEGKEKYDFMVKVIVIGDSGIGKTNLITRFCENAFKDSYVATIGVDFKIKTLTHD